MKKLITLSCTFLMATTCLAQQNRLKLDEIVQKHKEEMAQKQEEPVTSIYENKEKGDYHFQRWLWYAKQHTDQNGYIVPVIDANSTWRKYEAQTNRAAFKTTADQSDWKAIGPFSQGGISRRNGEIGRINTVALNPQNPTEMIVGTAGGGAWKIDNIIQYLQGKATWTPITENLMTSSIADIDYNPSNPSTIYICTGDREYPSQVYSRSLSYSSIGLIKSTDGGKNWDTTGYKLSIKSFVNTNSLVINPNDTNSLTLATDVGIWKSYDAGKSWQKAVMHTPISNYKRGRIFELVYHPTDTGIIYASSKIDSVNSQGQLVNHPPAIEILKSTDGGMNWDVQITINEAYRAAMAVTPSSPNILKLIVAKADQGLEGIYHSNNSGNTFIKIFEDVNCKKNLLSYATSGNGCGGQGGYDLCIAIDPTNVNHVIIGGVNTWESIDGGLNWKLHSHYGTQNLNALNIHVDHHYIGFTPLGLVDCNDGGIIITDGTNIYDITAGMNITQYYRIGANNDASYLIGGAQDNGSHLINKATSISNSIMSGDGMDCLFDPVTPNIFYMSSQNGNFARWDLKKGISQSNAVNISNNINAPSDKSGAWTSPLLIDAYNHNRLITARKAVYKSDDQGDSWTAISTEFDNLIERLSMSYSSPGTIYATEDAVSKNIHYTQDTGTSWVTIQHPYNESRIADIKADHFNAKRFWITFPGFGYNKTKVAEYNNGTWATMNENLPDLPVFCIIQDTTDKTLYIGTYVGVYYRTTKMNQWEKFSTNLPIVNVFDLEINYATNELIAGTWGRGIWATPKYKEPLTVATSAKAIQPLDVYPNPSNGAFSIATDMSEFYNRTVSTHIVDVAGKTVYAGKDKFAGNKISLNITNLTAGIYIIKLTNDNGETASKQITIK